MFSLFDGLDFFFFYIFVPSRSIRNVGLKLTFARTVVLQHPAIISPDDRFAAVKTYMIINHNSYWINSSFGNSMRKPRLDAERMLKQRVRSRVERRVLFSPYELVLDREDPLISGFLCPLIYI